MFKKSTVFIIGAGASAECDLPVGAKLKEDIATALRFRFEFGDRQTSGDPYLLDILKRKFGKDINTYTRAGNELAKVMSTFISVDEALHYFSNRPEVVLLGKLEIARQILKAERESSLKFDTQLGRPNTEMVAGSWIAKFLSMAMAGLRREEIQKAFESITIINFNYDRVVEHYLYWALQSNAGADAETAKVAITRLKIIRPYGGLGQLDWQHETGTKFGGNEYREDEIFSLVDGLRTYTEQIHSDVPGQIDAALTAAILIVFIGFGFHDSNLELFEAPTGRKPNSSRQIFATVYGIHPENFQTLAGRLQNELRAVTGRVKLLQLKGSEMLQELRPSLLSAAA